MTSIEAICDRYNELAALQDDKTAEHWADYLGLEDQIYEDGYGNADSDLNPALMYSDAWYTWEKGVDDANEQG